jgi:hypothetical protein
MDCCVDGPLFLKFTLTEEDAYELHVQYKSTRTHS